MFGLRLSFIEHCTSDGKSAVPVIYIYKFEHTE